MLSKKFKVISPAPVRLWKELEAQDAFALAEHSVPWVQALTATGGLLDESRFYEFSDGKQFLLPLMRRTGMRGIGGNLQSYPPAWGMGGTLGHGLEPTHAKLILEDLRALGAQHVSILPDPLRWHPWRTAAQDVGAHVIPRRAHIVDLSDGLDAAFQRFSRTTRRGVRNALRSELRVEIGNSKKLLTDFYHLLRLSVDRWAEERNQPKFIARRLAEHRTPFEHFRIKRDYSAERFVIVCAYLRDHPVSALVTLVGKNAHEMHGAMDQERAGNSRSGDLVRWSSLEYSYRHGCRFHSLGESGDSTALAFAKEKYGARPYEYGEIVLQRVPWIQMDRALRSRAKYLLGART